MLEIRNQEQIKNFHEFFQPDEKTFQVHAN